MTKTREKPPKPDKAKDDLSPIECKEHLDEVLEMELEVNRRERRMDASHKTFKEDKEQFELKRDELLQYLKGLNEEHPLFDDHNTIDIPFTFPLPDGTHDATLANVAADPQVLGLSVSVVKSVRDKLGGVSTLGQLEQYLKADKVLSPADQTKAKQKLGKDLGPNQAMKLLRAVASFTGNRAKTSGKKGKVKPEECTDPVHAKVKELTTPAGDWRDTKVADLDAITPMQSQLLGQLEMGTVGKVLDRFKVLLKDMKPGAAPDFLRKQLAAFMAVTPSVAGKIIDVIYAFEEEQTIKEGS